MCVYNTYMRKRCDNKKRVSAPWFGFFVVFLLQQKFYVFFVLLEFYGGAGVVKFFFVVRGYPISFLLLFLPNLSFSLVDKKWYLGFSFFRTVDQMMIVAV